jgi:pimeloyl-ACP methyl ester carboxylesterase
MILLHGAGLGPWIWDRVLPHLKTEARTFDRTVEATLEQCIDEVVPHAEGRVVVGHSFAAQIALGVAAKVRPRAVVLIGGMLARPGKPFLSLLPLPQRLIVGTMLRRAKNGIDLPKKLVRKEYCNDLDEATTQLVLERVRPEAPRLYLDPAEWRGDIAPRVYFRLLEDKSVSQRMQERMIELTAARVKVLDSGHLPMLSQPETVAGLLNELL